MPSQNSQERALDKFPSKCKHQEVIRAKKMNQGGQIESDGRAGGKAVPLHLSSQGHKSSTSTLSRNPTDHLVSTEQGRTSTHVSLLHVCSFPNCVVTKNECPVRREVTAARV